MKIKTENMVQCTNCQRPIEKGEFVNTPSQDDLNRGDAVCADCRPFGKEKPAAETAEEKKDRLAAEKLAKELEAKAGKDKTDGKPEG